MRVLVSGGAGFIGSALVRHLAARGGYEITVLDNLSSQVHGQRADFPEALRSQARCLRGDVTVAGDWSRALEGQDAVVHLAAETGTGQSMYECARYVHVNVMGTALLLDALRSCTHNVGRIVLASSRAVYGEGCHECPEHGLVYPGARSIEAMLLGDFEIHCPTCGVTVRPAPTSEQAARHPLSVYAATKAAQEDLLSVYALSSAVECVALRFQNVFGPGQSLRNPYTGILSIFTGLILSGREIELYEDGRESRDFVFVEDAVAAVRLALEGGRLPQLPYNVGSGTPTSVAKVASVLTDALQSEVPVRVSSRFRAGDVRHCVADTRASTRDLGFAAEVSFEEGVGRFLDWVRGQSLPPSRYEESIRELQSHSLLRKAEVGKA